MNEILKQMEERLKQLKIGYENQKANLYAQEGAIQECEKWINVIKEIE
jgi:hypothetical protein